MGHLSTDIPIFLSSTFTDLKELRCDVARRLQEVFGAQLIVMESFGSDEAPPAIASVRRVRECDVFVGIYAHRYGTVDPSTGKSITELELDEAERALSAGNIVGILLFLLDEAAPWPAARFDTDAAAIQGLEHLKQRAKQHTITKFRKSGDLPFLVIKGVLTKIKDRLSVASPTPRHFDLPNERTLVQPIGMEFLTSADRQRFCGRKEKVRELLHRVGANPITLLLGNSGSGKTSLIHAGLFPDAVANGWRPVYARPLGLPRSDVSIALFGAIFEGASTYRGSLIPLLEQAGAAVRPRRVLLVVDQFEDILSSREQAEAERLVEDLRTIRYLEDPNIRVLLSYRADLEARLGQFWQLLSGSPRGLARVYLTGIIQTEAWKSTEKACMDLHVKVALTAPEAEQIQKDLLSSSARQGEEGVYPPYIQMLIDHMWRTTAEGSTSYQMRDYLAAGGMEGVTGGYLTRQLTYAQDTGGHIKSVLVSLVRSYGVKAQKSLADIITDTSLGEQACELALERLIDLRLVRHIRDMYEVAHDFLAHEISAKLIDSEEREFKRFRELLATKAAAFNTTRSLLTVMELLVLFNYRERVLPSDGELRLILASWARVKAPGLFWILTAPPSRVAELVRAEEGKGELEDDGRAMLVLLRRRVTGRPFHGRDWMVFRRYRLGLEMAALLSSHATECPDPVISFALRSRHRNVRAAAIEAVAQKIKLHHWKWISDLGKSSSPLKREVFEILSLRTDLPSLLDILPANATRSLREFALLQQLSRAEPGPAVAGSLKALRQFRPRTRSWILGHSIARNKRGGLRSMLKRISSLSGAKISVSLNALHGDIDSRDFSALLASYLDANVQEAAHMGERSQFRRAIYENKATAIATAILRTSTKSDLNSLRRALQRIILTPSSQYCVLALIGVGNTQDILRIIKKVQTADIEVLYWFQIQVARAIEKRMADFGRPIPSRLRQICNKKGFWEFPQGRLARKHLLALRRQSNRALYIRLVGHAMIGAARMRDSALLQKLSLHAFHLIARAAAIRLVKLGDDAGMKVLQSAMVDGINPQRAESLALALRDAEIQKLGLAQLW